MNSGPIPENAIEIVWETWETGDKRRAFYLVDGKEIGFRYWLESGELVMEWGLKDGVRHGLYRTFHDNGQIAEERHYVDGKEHGETVQYDWNGVRIGSYVMDHGTGVDLWFCSPGVLSEEREFRDGERQL